MTIWHKPEKDARAVELGFADYDDAIVTMYRDEELSLSQVSAWWGLAWYTIRFRLAQFDIQFRPRGGKNHKRSYYHDGGSEK